jgi:hypothetical protein
MRFPRAPILPLLLLASLACGGGAPGSPKGGAEGTAAPPLAAAVPAGASAAPPAPAADPAPADGVPEELRTGAASARAAAVADRAADPGATAALTWVLQNDVEPAVRQKAWRALRTRWETGTGAPDAHEAAAVWAAASAEEAIRVEALAALGARGRDVAAPGKHLADPATRVRAAAAEAVVAIAGRTGKRADAKTLLQARLLLESDGPLRRKLDGWVDGL